MYILSGKNGRFNSSSRTLFGDRAKRVYVLLVYCCSLFANGRENADGSWFGVQKPATTARELTNEIFLFLTGRGFTFLPGY